MAGDEEDQYPHQGKAENPWVDSVRRIFQRREADLKINPTLKMVGVPEPLRENSPDAFVPKVLQVGAFNRDFQKLTRMDAHKIAVCMEFSSKHGYSDFNHLIRAVIKDADSSRNLYHNDPGITSEALELLLVVDALFVLKFIEFYQHYYKRQHNNLYFNIPELFSQRILMLYDLLLMENQIPLSLLSKLLHIEKSLMNPRVGLSDAEDELEKYLKGALTVVCPFKMRFKNSQHMDLRVDITNNQVRFRQCQHLLDCLYKALVYDHEHPPDLNIGHRSTVLPSASELVKAGIKLKTYHGNLRSIRFEQDTATLSLPALKMYPTTETLLRNLFAYEFATQPTLEFRSYSFLMQSLIQSSKDVELLTRCKILDDPDNIGHEKIAAIWMTMNKPLQYRVSSECSSTLEGLKRYYDNHRFAVQWNDICTLYRVCGEVFFQSLASSICHSCNICGDYDCPSNILYNCWILQELKR